MINFHFHPDRTSKIFLLVLCLFSLAACLPENLSSPISSIPHTPSSNAAATEKYDMPPQQIVTKFLEAWKNDDTTEMYGYLTPISQDAFSLDEFTAQYQEAAIDLSLQRLDYDLLSTLVSSNNAQVACRVIYHTVLMDELQRDMVFSLALDRQEWKIQWERGLILPELSGANELAVDISVPARGNIYDNEGNAIVVQSRAFAVGVEPSQVNPATEHEFVKYLGILTGKDESFIEEQLRLHASDEYIAIGDVSEQELNAIESPSIKFNGLVLQPYEARYYLDHGIAPQTIGYAMPIPAEDVDEYRRLGYRGDEKVGMAGLEKWGENDLMGRRGADVYVVSPDGEIVTRLSHRESGPAKSIYTTLDRNLQIQAQKALEGFRGAIVVLERDSGRVLAIVSSPHFDPNVFNTDNINSQAFLSQLMTDEEQSLLNRATQGVYPLGSVFKIITLSAALESGVYTETMKYNCTYEYREIPGLVLYDWTYQYGVAASGVITLSEGFMRSCNPWFWHIGLDLYFNYDTTAISDMARAFGLGEATGLNQASEDSGLIEDPNDEGDAIQMAIGQGTVLVTPLQVAVLTAAVGNGGTLYRPQMTEKIVSPDGQVSLSFRADDVGKLPLQDENLAIIQDAMLGVVEYEHGTAHTRFLGLNIPVYGKTGTAQNPFGDAHSWFAGYTDAGLSEKPDIAAVVIAENAGEGSDIAAPIFRRVVESYFFGKPTTLFPWEKSLYEPFTPTPENTGTADMISVKSTGTPTP